MNADLVGGKVLVRRDDVAVEESAREAAGVAADVQIGAIGRVQATFAVSLDGIICLPAKVSGLELFDHRELSRAEPVASSGCIGEVAPLAQLVFGLDRFAFEPPPVGRGRCVGVALDRLRSTVGGHGLAQEVCVPATREEDDLCHLLGSAPPLPLATESAVLSPMHKLVSALLKITLLQLLLKRFTFVFSFAVAYAVYAFVLRHEVIWIPKCPSLTGMLGAAAVST